MDSSRLLSEGKNICMLDKQIQDADSAFYSLRLGILAYYKTYQAMRWELTERHQKDYNHIEEKKSMLNNI